MAITIQPLGQGSYQGDDIVYAVNPDGSPISGSGGTSPPSSQLPATLGQKTMAASMSVAVASDQSILPVQEGPFTYSRKTADGQVKGSAGYLHTVTFSPTGTVVAGVVTIYDSLTETGTVVLSISLPVTTFTPFSVTLNVTMATGIFIGYDATVANVQVTASYR